MQEIREVLELELSIQKPPVSVKSWWTDLPDDYYAKDSTEQPFRILTTRKTSDGRELLTYWRLPDGSVRENREIMKVKAGATWTFEIPNHPLGFRIFDEFNTKETKDGTVLHIRSTIVPLAPGASARLAVQKERMEQVWRRAAEICERDAI